MPFNLLERQVQASLTPAQLDLVERPLDSKLFLEGPWGCGKSTVGVERLLYLMAHGVPASSILLLAPQRTLAWPYAQALETPGVTAGGQVSILTVGGLAQRMVDLFWPLAAEEAGFAHPEQPPVFLTLETAQYYMAHLVEPLLAQGYFSSVTLEPNRIYSQILDNLNKSALMSFDYHEIGARLSVAALNELAQKRVYADAQACAEVFRQYCLAHNLLDFSLQVEVFWRWLWPHSLCRGYLERTYRHLIADNLEEDTPVTHDLLAQWLPQFDSALLIYDQNAGYRSFLGADPHTGYALKDLCSESVLLDHNLVQSEPVRALRHQMAVELEAGQNSHPGSNGRLPAEAAARLHQALCFEYHHYYPQMLDWVVSEAGRLIQAEGLAPGEIVVLAPYLPDASLYALADRFQQAGIPVRAHRPSRSLRDEPVTHCLITLAQLAHPQWGLSPSPFEVTSALVQAIGGLDWVRAQILTGVIYSPPKNGQPGCLRRFEVENNSLIERIPFRLTHKYDDLFDWLDAYPRDKGQELDHFWRRLFGEILSQPGYGFHGDYHSGEVAANLIESAQKFRCVTQAALSEDGISVEVEYLKMVQQGVIAAQYIRSWDDSNQDAVLLAPAYTFLMGNRPARVQFWLNLSSEGWHERLYQPLTNPYVLNRDWPAGRLWTFTDEEAVTQQTLARLALGLLDRCQDRLYLGWSELNEQGREERGRLLHTFQRLMKHVPRP